MVLLGVKAVLQTSRFMKCYLKLISGQMETNEKVQKHKKQNLHTQQRITKIGARGIVNVPKSRTV